MAAYVLATVGILGVLFFLCCVVAFLREMSRPRRSHPVRFRTALGKIIETRNARSRQSDPENWEAISPRRDMTRWSVRELGWLNASFGALLCLGIASALSVFLRHSSFKTALPICFLFVILLVAIRFGSLAGALGTIFAEVIFALFLFEPLRSLAVQSQAGRESLLWMFLGGIALSELCGNRPKRGSTGPPSVGGRAAS